MGYPFYRGGIYMEFLKDILPYLAIGGLFFFMMRGGGCCGGHGHHHKKSNNEEDGKENTNKSCH
jgi:hypothetical protein